MADSSLSSLVVPIVLYVLYALSVVTWGMLVIKLVQFARSRMRDNAFQKAFWSAESLEQGETISEKHSGPIANIAHTGFGVITGRDIAPGNRDLAHSINRSDRLERALRQQIQRERRSLESGLAVLASFGSTSPFIGLFGTVVGIMNALVAIGQTGQAGLDTVAGPIGHALTATALGIAVAVPAVWIYNYLTRRVKAGVHHMEEFAHDYYSLAQQSAFQTQSSQFSEPEPAADSSYTPQGRDREPRPREERPGPQHAPA